MIISGHMSLQYYGCREGEKFIKVFISYIYTATQAVQKNILYTSIYTCYLLASCF